jgi:threonine/homoserine/homoserine lactone efflux protein
MTLVIAQTLRFGAREGVKVAIAPLLTDLPIVAGSVFVLSTLSEIDSVLGVIALCGGAFLAYLGRESLFFKGADPDVASVNPRSIRKGTVANFLNPSPYVFWITIGAPTFLSALDVAAAAAILFIAGFYLCLVGAKVAVAVIVSRSRRFLRSDAYVYAVRALGLALFFIAVLFFRDGLAYLGLI